MVLKSAQESFRRTVPEMQVCWHCRFHVYAGTAECPHCGSNVAEAARVYQGRLDHVRQLKEQLENILQRAQKRAPVKKKPRDRTVARKKR